MCVSGYGDTTTCTHGAQLERSECRGGLSVIARGIFLGSGFCRSRTGTAPKQDGRLVHTTQQTRLGTQLATRKRSRAVPTELGGDQGQRVPRTCVLGYQRTSLRDLRCPGLRVKLRKAPHLPKAGQCGPPSGLVIQCCDWGWFCSEGLPLQPDDRFDMERLREEVEEVHFRYLIAGAGQHAQIARQRRRIAGDVSELRRLQPGCD